MSFTLSSVCTEKNMIQAHRICSPKRLIQLNEIQPDLLWLERDYKEVYSLFYCVLVVIQYAEVPLKSFVDPGVLFRITDHSLTDVLTVVTYLRFDVTCSDGD